MQQLGNMKENFDDLSDPEQFACLVGCLRDRSLETSTYLCSYQLHETHVKTRNKSETRENIKRWKMLQTAVRRGKSLIGGKTRAVTLVWFVLIGF